MSLPRVRRSFTVRTVNGWRTYKTKWVNTKSYSASVMAESRTLEISRHRLTFHDRKPEDPPCRFCGRRKRRLPECQRFFLRSMLAHEITHMLYEKDEELDDTEHFRWEFAHDNLADHTARVEHIIRTGRDIPERIIRR